MALRLNKTSIHKETTVVETKKVAKARMYSTGEPAPSLIDLHNQMDPVVYGNVFPFIITSNGICEEYYQDIDLGKHIDIQVLSISERWMIEPVSDEKDKDAAKFSRASYDGKNILTNEGGEITIDDYIASVEEYEEFSEPKKYLDIFALIINTANKNKEVQARGLGIVMISVPPIAIKYFYAFEVQTKLFLARGSLTADKQNCIRINAETTQNRFNSWTFEPIPLQDIEHYTPISM